MGRFFADEYYTCGDFRRVTHVALKCLCAGDHYHVNVISLNQ